MYKMIAFLLICHSINNKIYTHRPKIRVIINITFGPLSKNYSKLTINKLNTKNVDEYDNISDIDNNTEDYTAYSSDHTDYETISPTDNNYTIKDPEIYVPLIIAGVLLISILVGTIICFKKYCPTCLPCVLC